MTAIMRGQIFFCDLGKGHKREQGGLRPVLIVQNNVGNKYSPTTVIIPITSSRSKANLPTHVLLKASKMNGLKCDSLAMAEQVRVIDKSRLREYIGCASQEEMTRINESIMVSLGVSL